MENETQTYADVLLPLAVPGAFTYRVPPSLAGSTRTGSRVVVPFGKRKFYTGIVVRLHGDPPAGGFTVKDVADVMDPRPVILPVQLDLWRWLSSYYLCTPGEVMKAALPSGLKLESETVVAASPDSDSEAGTDATERAVLQLLEGGKAMSVDALERALRLRGLLPAVRRLVEAGALRVHESLVRAFKPRTETRVRLTEAYADEGRLSALFDTLERSPRQRDVLLAYLDASRAAAALTLHNRALLRDVAKRALLERVAGGESALKALRDKGVLETYAAETDRIRLRTAIPGMAARPLSEAQQEALDAVTASWEKRRVCLLHGVTSSGKTEIYIRLIQRELDAGRQVLYLLPEIALTTQITTRLGRVFGERMGVYHSKFPDAERVELWQRQLSDHAFPLILGVRSALFLPFRHLGLIIVDEEHEASYKQQDPAPRYHARDTAIVLAGLCGAKVLLGTATPALETYFNATEGGKYGLVTLSRRYDGSALPSVTIADMRLSEHTPDECIGQVLREQMQKVYERGKQSMLFLNRRGYHNLLSCRACGEAVLCPNCSVSLTHHKTARGARLLCHYCGYSIPVPHFCPNCGSEHLAFAGYGTQRIEDEIAAFLPEAKILRMDADTTKERFSQDEITAAFGKGDADILIGTQMIAKGHNFPNLALVGVVAADSSLFLDDFRANEKTFSLITQVIGRAGREDGDGHAVIQTYNPENETIRRSAAQDYEAFYQNEIAVRRALVFPPFCDIAVFSFSSDEETALRTFSGEFAGALKHKQQSEFEDVKFVMFGPFEAPVYKVKNKYRMRIVMKFKNNKRARALFASLLMEYGKKAQGKIALSVDINPTNT